jgi:cytochrome c biogenesis protein CcdA
MTEPAPDDDKPLSPEQAQIVAKVRWLMLLSGLATFIGIAVVLGVVGMRMFRTGNTMSDVTAMIPKGAKVVQTSTAGDHVVVTFEVGGATEIRSFDARTLKQVGRLRFAVEA